MKKDANPAVATTEAVIYLRVSTDEQAETHLSLDAQETRCRAYCGAIGLEVVSVCRDVVSTRVPPSSRPGLVQALRTLKPGRALLVMRLDRLCRKIVDLYEIHAAIDQQAGRFASVEERIDTTTPQGVAFRDMLMVFAQFELASISHRTKLALAAKQGRGEFTGRVPYGYKAAGNGRLERVEQQQQVIEKIKDLRALNMGFTGIAATLNEMKVPSPTGTKWSSSSVWRVHAREAA